MKKRRKAILRLLTPLGLLFATLFLCGCGGRGYSGGIVFGIFHEGVWEECGSNYSSATVEGKRTTIDGVEITLPVDYAYGKSKQSDFNGANWNGDDAVRGVGLFSVEDGDNTGAADDTFDTQYSVNMRWCYARFSSVVAGKYPQHKNYKAHSDKLDMDVGGTDEGGSNIVLSDCENSQASNEKLEKARILLYCPETDKACICQPGFYQKKDGKWQSNWGGNPLALEFGISPIVKDTLGATQNSSILEAYFVSEDSELGECSNFDGTVAKGSVGSGNKCLSRSANIKASSTADLAVSCAYDETNEETKKFNGHEMIEYASGSTSGDKQLPSTNLARELRRLATNNKDDRSADCGYFVASVVRCTLDKEFPESGTDNIQKYCEDSSKWQKIDMISPTMAVSKNIIEPGDVFVVPRQGSQDGHTMIYTGNEAILEQFGTSVEGGYLTDKDYTFVGAWHDKRGPTIQKTSYQGDRPYYIYRYIGTPDPIASEEEIKNLIP